MVISDTEIDELITCRKRITHPPRKEMIQDSAHRRNDFKCEGIEGDDRFRVFMRQNLAFPENFSIGLVYLCDDGSEVTLLRCNGPHGPVVDDPLATGPNSHVCFHIHQAQAAIIEAGLRPEAGAVATTKYGTFEDALAYFVRRCGIEEAEQYFFSLRNPTLF
jgi:hypothetical protein